MSSPDSRAPSLQRRLTLGLAVALGAILTLMSAGIDYLVDSELHAYMDERLMSRAHAIANLIEPPHSDPDALHRVMPEYRYGHVDFFEIWDAFGVSVYRSESSMARGLELPPGWPAATPRYYDTRLPDGHDGRALALPLELSVDGRRQWYTLVVASERTFEERLETAIDYALIAGVVLALLLTLSIARWAVRRGLAPVLRAGERIGHGLQPSGALDDPALPAELRPFTRALDAAFGQLQEAIERERRFSLNVAHELRTPLSEIRIAAEVAMRLPNNGSSVRTAFATSLSAVERMQRAIDTLLLLARYESGQASPALDPLDLSALLDTLLDALAPLAAQRDIAFARAYAAGVWVSSDHGALERIASNLLRNAIAYAPRGSRVDVCVQAGEKGVALIVGNPAPDLAPEDLARLGERFWRKSPAGGTTGHAGLGLPLALALAQSLRLAIDFTLDDGRLAARVGDLPKL